MKLVKVGSFHFHNILGCPTALIAVGHFYWGGGNGKGLAVPVFPATINRGWLWDNLDA